MTFLMVMSGFVEADADVLTFAPDAHDVRVNEETGATEILVRFDVSGMRTGLGRRIESAFLEGMIPGVPADRRSVYTAFAVSSDWTSESMTAGTEPVISATEVASWDVEPLDYQRNGGGFIRFDLRDLAEGWANGTIGNNGVAISTHDVEVSAVAGQPTSLRLVIRYGFIIWDD